MLSLTAVQKKWDIQVTDSVNKVPHAMTPNVLLLFSFSTTVSRNQTSKVVFLKPNFAQI